MKIYSKMLPAAALMMFAATSCSDETPVVNNAEGDTSVTFTAELPGVITSRAYSDGLSATKLTYAVYEAGSTDPVIKPGDAVYQDVTFADRKASLTLQLVNGKKYDILFWADVPDGSPYTFDPTTQSITVDYDGAMSNDESRDAFFASKAEFAVNGPSSETVELHRPFAQVNIGTDDLDKVIGNAPKTTKVVTKAYNTLNLLTAQTGGTTMVDVTYDYADIPAEETFPVDGYEYLSMNYLLMGADKELVDVAFTVSDGTSDINTINIPSVPVQRNYRTNIYGSLLTSPNEFNIVIVPEYETPDHNYSELLLAAAAGGFVTLQEDISLDEQIEVAAGKSMVIDLNGHTITQTDTKGSVFQVYGDLTINGEGTVRGGENGDCNVVWAMSGSKVTINGGTYSVGPDASGLGNACIYSYGGDIVINGGTFSSDAAYNNKYYVLNMNNNFNGSITCYGGTFINQDPAGGDDYVQPTSFVAEGYSSLKISDTPAPYGTFQVIEGKIASTADDFAAAIATQGAKVTVPEGASIDISGLDDEIILSEGTTIINNGSFVTSKPNQLVVDGVTVTVSGSGTFAVTGTEGRGAFNVINDGTLIADGITITTEQNNRGSGIYTDNGNLKLSNVKIDAAYYAIGANGGTAEVDNCTFNSSSTNLNGSWAYCLSFAGTEATLNECTVTGIQGGLAVIDGGKVTVNGGDYSTENTLGHNDAFYAAYIANNGELTINSGKFYSPRYAVFNGNNDVSTNEFGYVYIYGGEFSSIAWNQKTGTEYPLPTGYKFVDNDSERYPLKVVAE